MIKMVAFCSYNITFLTIFPVYISVRRGSPSGSYIFII